MTRSDLQQKRDGKKKKNKEFFILVALFPLILNLYFSNFSFLHSVIKYGDWFGFLSCFAIFHFHKFGYIYFLYLMEKHVKVCIVHTDKSLTKGWIIK